MAGIFTSTASLAGGTEQVRRGAPHWLEQSLATPEELRDLSEWDEHLAQLKEQLRDARQMQAEFPGDVDSSKLAGVVVDNLAAEVHGAWKESNYSTNFVDKNYLHDGDADKGKKSVRYVANLPKAGLYDVEVSYTPRANRATNVPVTVWCKGASKTVPLNQTLLPTIDKVFASVGKFTFDAGTNTVLISNEGTKGFVVADAVRFVPAELVGVAAGNRSDEHNAEASLLSYRQLEREFLQFRQTRPVLPQALAVQDGKVQDCRIPMRGEANAEGDVVSRSLPTVVATPESTAYAITDESSGRLELANWIARPENPLTARVAVNRIWLHLFGRGLVDTPDEFGADGARPSHPELLDHLAGRFVEQGWSVKKLIRSIMLSSTYQMSSKPHSGASTKDPANAWLWRMTPREIQPDALRDAMLAISGQLDATPAGPWMPTNSPATGPLQILRQVQTTSRHRSVYLPVLRDTVPDVLRVFAPSTGSNAPTSSQAPFVQNRFVREQSQAWADALLRVPAADDAQRVVLAYRQALGRPPSADEAARASQLLQRMRDSSAPASAWDKLCLEILASSEFRTLE